MTFNIAKGKSLICFFSPPPFLGCGSGGRRSRCVCAAPPPLPQPLGLLSPLNREKLTEIGKKPNLINWWVNNYPLQINTIIRTNPTCLNKEISYPPLPFPTTLPTARLKLSSAAPVAPPLFRPARLKTTTKASRNVCGHLRSTRKAFYGFCRPSKQTQKKNQQNSKPADLGGEFGLRLPL